MMSVDETLLCSFQVSPRHSSSPTLLSGRAFADPLLVSVDPETGREEEDVRVRRSRSGSPGYSATQGEGRQDQVNRFAWPPSRRRREERCTHSSSLEEKSHLPLPSRRARVAPPLAWLLCSYHVSFSSSLLPPPPSPLFVCVCVCLPLSGRHYSSCAVVPLRSRPDPIPLFSLSRSLSPLNFLRTPSFPGAAHARGRHSARVFLLTCGNSGRPLCSNDLRSKPFWLLYFTSAFLPCTSFFSSPSRLSAAACASESSASEM